MLLRCNFLGREQRKAFFEIETHLMPEYGERAGTGAVFFTRAFRQESVVRGRDIVAWSRGDENLLQGEYPNRGSGEQQSTDGRVNGTPFARPTPKEQTYKEADDRTDPEKLDE